jgi:hypothetical protein
VAPGASTRGHPLAALGRARPDGHGQSPREGGQKVAYALLKCGHLIAEVPTFPPGGGYSKGVSRIHPFPGPGAFRIADFPSFLRSKSSDPCRRRPVTLLLEYLPSHQGGRGTAWSSTYFCGFSARSHSGWLSFTSPSGPCLPIHVQMAQILLSILTPSSHRGGGGTAWTVTYFCLFLPYGWFMFPDALPTSSNP